MARNRLAKRSHAAWLWQSKRSRRTAGGVTGAALSDGRTKGNDPPSGLVASRGNRFGPDLAGKRIFHIGSARKSPNGPIAQLDRVTDFYSVGCRFESCWDRHFYRARTQTNQASCATAQFC